MANLRFYTNIPLILGATIQLSASAAAHATRALRLNVDDSAIVFNGDGFDYECKLTSIKKNEVHAKITASKKINNASPLRITLLQAISSGDRMDFTIQKAVELGVTGIQPITSQRSVVKLSAERAEKRTEHWQNIAISACEQSGRTLVPNVAAPLSLQQWLAANPKADCIRLLLNPTGALRLAELAKPNDEIQLLIGAEGGLTEFEIDLANSYGFQSIVLGPRILRTETAALATISALQTLWGDF
ncbi:16S rRNA (uracil(1498)-N(3))-methyltransferase [Methylotenera sp.]|uniref:16S rRNA (uracil(1498)-N(3))-methyltransferase n=1 Tax=Methylotenera sp. TaxID=2051956 RepID=UPI00272F7178|nr:16S rRNA (uracil(1498)-N(3))-methyltransferase [Methylotenera sp.]MDP2070747.1 16S rRNA (uracil(1498)-N(3))-methyltransferase [Methylotenera sp.]MDP3004772.1 16S rRNA (uracil(1498)-N(3))-methyltransferase [Methylotenera sp.]